MIDNAKAILFFCVLVAWGVSVVSAEIQVRGLQEKISALQEDKADLEREMNDDDAIFLMAFGEEWDRRKVLMHTQVRLTCYTSRVQECDEFPHEVADGTMVRVGIIAVSLDLMRDYNLVPGQRCFIPGYGMFEIRDTMPGERRVDIWMQDVEAARLHGVKFVQIYWFA